MVKLTKIYTKTGDDGSTALADGSRRAKHDLRIATYGAVDEANAAIGLARLYTGEMQELDAVLARLQNDLFDLGADLATPENVDFEALRIVPQQVARLESEIDRLNGDLTPLESFILPGGHPAAAHLHLARTIMRRAERILSAATAQNDEAFSEPARAYINRASDLLFVAARAANAGENGAGDILWQPAATRQPQ
ncbi:MAG: cob(I)yrinic acid a,c-diamide adenosyltransferase [Parvibaculales bacterium]